MVGSSRDPAIRYSCQTRTGLRSGYLAEEEVPEVGEVLLRRMDC